MKKKAKKMYDTYVINNKSDIAVFPAWSLLPEHAKSVWIILVERKLKKSL